VVATLWYSSGPEQSESTIERTRTDGMGRARLEVARERPHLRINYWYVWAYQPGRGIAVSRPVRPESAPPPLTRLTLHQPAKRTITVLGPDDRPVEGLRLAPYSLRDPNARFFRPILPGQWADRLSATTDARGVITLNDLPPNLAPLAVRVSGPGVAPHTLPLGEKPGPDYILRLGRAGRLVGVIRAASGEPLADIPVEIWVRGHSLGTVPGTSQALPINPDEVVHLDPQPLKTGPQGAFQTPPALLGGSTYRLVIRREGFAPFVSGWVTLDGERATMPDIRLQPLQQVTGRITDRPGRAAAGARVFLPAGGPATVSDADGRFALGGIPPGKAVILVERPGFRLQGRVVDPSARDDLGPFTLVRSDESEGPAMRPQADPIPPEESRALADRLLEPYLPEDPEKGDNRARLTAISVLGGYDPDRALRLLRGSEFPDDLFYHNTCSALAGEVATKYPARAEALVEAIPVPLVRAEAFARLVKALPASERDRRRALLDRAGVLLRKDLPQLTGTRRLRLIAAVAGPLLDMGERDRARLVLDEGKTSSTFYQSGYLGQLARLDPDQALMLARKVPDFASTYDLAELASGCAIEHPAEAERIFDMRVPATNEIYFITNELRLCRRLARVDRPRAGRVAASLSNPGARACAWAFVALGQAESGGTGAAEAIDRAIQEIDRLRESGPGLEQVIIAGGIRIMYPTNPAAVMLPVVERVAPDRLAEVLWRAVALSPRIDPGRDEPLRTSYLGFECTLLARYDREVAAALFQPMEAYLRSLAARKGPQDQFNSACVVAFGCLDPRGALALLEALMPPREFARYHPYHDARLTLAEVLGLPHEKRWKRLWRSMGAQLPLDD
jgi:hypothetical protein